MKNYTPNNKKSRLQSMNEEARMKATVERVKAYLVLMVVASLLTLIATMVFGR